MTQLAIASYVVSWQYVWGNTKCVHRATCVGSCTCTCNIPRIQTLSKYKNYSSAAVATTVE